MFRFATGKLRRSYDESMEAAQDLQRSGGDATKLDAIDFGRRLAVRPAAALRRAFLEHDIRYALRRDGPRPGQQPF